MKRKYFFKKEFNIIAYPLTATPYQLAKGMILTEGDRLTFNISQIYTTQGSLQVSTNAQKTCYKFSENIHSRWKNSPHEYSISFCQKRYAADPDTPAKNIVITMPGLMGNYYLNEVLETELVSESKGDTITYAFDPPSQGHSFPQKILGLPRWPSTHVLINHLADMVAYVRSEHPEAIITVLGHSAGAATAILAPEKIAPHIDHLILLAPASQKPTAYLAHTIQETLSQQLGFGQYNVVESETGDQYDVLRPLNHGWAVLSIATLSGRGFLGFTSRAEKAIPNALKVFTQHQTNVHVMLPSGDLSLDSKRSIRLYSIKDTCVQIETLPGGHTTPFERNQPLLHYYETVKRKVYTPSSKNIPKEIFMRAHLTF